MRSASLKIYTCLFCGYDFNDYSNRKKHVEEVHEGKKPYSCTECNVAYGQKGNLKRHISSVHDKVKAFKCKMCPADFVRKEKLDTHGKKCAGTKEKISEKEI